MKIDAAEGTGRTMEPQLHDQFSFALSRAPVPNIREISGFNSLPYKMSTDDNPNSTKYFIIQMPISTSFWILDMGSCRLLSNWTYT